MDAYRFDAVTRVLGAASSRRAMAIAVGSLVSGSGMALLPLDRAWGKKKKKSKKKKKKQQQKNRKCRKTCSDGICCGGKCVMSTIDRNNCGACGNVCSAAQYCYNGTCAPCEQPRAVCAVAGVEFCVDVKTDRENCGACSITCPRDPREPMRDLICQDGQCVCTGVICPNGRCCPAGWTVCVDGGDGCCPNNYQSCGNGRCCPVTHTCGGACGQECCER